MTTFPERFDPVIDGVEQAYFFLSRQLNAFKSPIRIVLVYGLPYFIGAVLGDVAAQKYSGKKSWLDWELWKQHEVLLPLTLFHLFGLVWQFFYNWRSAHALFLYNEIENMYKELGFEEVKREADVRCTVWVASNRKHNDVPVRLRQVIDYKPRMSALNGSANSYHINGKGKRSFKVFRYIGDNLVPVGILGQCVTSCIYSYRQHQDIPDLFLAHSPEPTDRSLVEFLCQDYFFRPRHARRCRQDRRSYLCITLTSHSREFLGILYIDSKCPVTLNKEMGERALAYRDRITQVLTLN